MPDAQRAHQLPPPSAVTITRPCPTPSAARCRSAMSIRTNRLRRDCRAGRCSQHGAGAVKLGATRRWHGNHAAYRAPSARHAYRNSVGAFLLTFKKADSFLGKVLRSSRAREGAAYMTPINCNIGMLFARRSSLRRSLSQLSGVAFELRDAGLDLFSRKAWAGRLIRKGIGRSIEGL